MVNSMGKILMTNGNSILGGEETEMIVGIFMNRYYMCYMHDHYGKQILKMYTFVMTVVMVTNKV